MTESERGEAPGTAEARPSGAAAAALGEEAVLNAAVAFAGHVATAAQQAAERTGDDVDPLLREAVFRQYLLETATLCLRRLEESYTGTAGGPGHGAVADLLEEGARQARDAVGRVESLGDLSLDILDRLLSDSPEAGP